jgi:serine/threonine protein kinase
MIGKTLAHYEITSQIGKGGMGEVYQATDTKLGRDVAIKVLPEEFAKDADRVARFQREAKLLASLNHPNIAAIYGLEESVGTHFLVMELVEGNTLDDRIKSGAIPVEEALKLALQITEALEAAHEKGVIHRDLKPANIKVTPDEKVKVLDFGLAKAFAGEQANLNLSNSPTLSQAATMQGVILGTAAYMSPEQARGKSVDKRADVWAFGVVLFEMLTGHPLFSGEDVSSTLAKILEREPDFSKLPSNLHIRIKLLLDRCLKKDIKNRYSGISDARVDIQEVLADPSGVFVQAVTTESPQKKLRTMLPWIAAAIIVAGMAVWLLKPSPPPEPKQVMRFDYELPKDQHLFLAMNGSAQIAVSPDGSQFAYSTTDGIYIREVKQLDARLISGTDKDAQSLFFSPDGQWLGYFSTVDQKLQKISVSGGAPSDLCSAALVFGAKWYENDTIVYSDTPTGVYRIPAKGGTPELLLEKPMVAGGQILPDGKSLLFIDVSSQPYKTMVHSLETGDQKIIFDGGPGFYLPTGHLYYGGGDNAFVVPFDLEKLDFPGGAVSVMEYLRYGYAFSDTGTLAYVSQRGNVTSGGAMLKSLVWVYRDGREEPLEAAPHNYWFAKVSPDGTKVALSVTIDGNQDIRIWDTIRKNLMRLTFDENQDDTPIWSPDGQKVVYSSGRVGGGIFCEKSDNTGEVEEISNVGLSFPFSWADDEKTLVFYEISLNPLGFNIGMLSLEGDRERKLLLHEKHAELEPKVSPNGKWIAYTSDENGECEIFVRPFPDVGKSMWQISTSGGHSPLWSPDSKELFYRNDDATIVVPLESESSFIPGNPEILFRGTYFEYTVFQPKVTAWDIHPDGDKFLMIKPAAVTDEESSETSTAAEPRKIIIVTNWFEELKEKVPVP